MLAAVFITGCLSDRDYVSIRPNEDEMTSFITETEAADGVSSDASVTTISETSFCEPVSDTVTAESETEAPPDSSGNIELVSLTTPIKRGNTAKISVKALPNTSYSISVVYSSGPSTAKGLEPKMSDSNGNVFWQWKVGSRTKAGTYTVTVSGGGKALNVSFTVTE